MIQSKAMGSSELESSQKQPVLPWYGASPTALQYFITEYESSVQNISGIPVHPDGSVAGMVVPKSQGWTRLGSASQSDKSAVDATHLTQLLGSSRFHSGSTKITKYNYHQYHRAFSHRPSQSFSCWKSNHSYHMLPPIC